MQKLYLAPLEMIPYWVVLVMIPLLPALVPMWFWVMAAMIQLLLMVQVIKLLMVVLVPTHFLLVIRALLILVVLSQGSDKQIMSMF